MASLHFTAAELNCRCGCGVNLCGHETYAMLEEFRRATGNMPVTVTSGYRCAEHNKAEGGALHSQHLLGNAADIVMPGKTAAQLERIAWMCDTVVGIGRNDHTGMLHIDCRPGADVKWCYDEQGKQSAYSLPKEEIAA